MCSMPASCIRLTYRTVLIFLIATLFAHPWIAAALGVPERMATHFNALGHADGWGGRDGFFLTLAILGTFIAGLFTLVPKLPMRAMNIPHRERWRGHDDALRAVIRGWAWQQATLLACLFHLLAVLAICANRSPYDLSEWAWLSPLMLIGGGTLICLIGLLRRLARGPTTM
jgi:uncharacterized membrane protein